ncbi:hypothetical protein EJ03DRAFT_344430 [Teratosphaeria nubilosa]|uniref:Nuclear pore complex subunit Nup192 n=1 Tax=Teratosphaeria nubilosa TaxID=161662 RepID=A0A6G1L494_9PEZI|nr:hypothetical protein EJ03DRAFT_344430 [Teratosphaeria nubilosa]
MELDDPLQRLLALKRDLSAFAEQRLPNVARLSAELDASIEDLKKLLERRKKNEASRKELVPTTTPRPETVKIQDVEYRINDDFRQAAMQVADTLDLDELEAAKLCVDASVTEGVEVDGSLWYRAVLRYLQYHLAVLECLRMVLQQLVDPADPEDDNRSFWAERMEAIVRAADGQANDKTAIWRKCISGLGDLETALKKVSDDQDTMAMTGVAVSEQQAEFLDARRLLITQQHESLVTIMALLVQGQGYVNEVGFREFFSKAAGLEAALDITYHYVPVIVGLSARFGSDEHAQPATSHELRKLFAAGPGQQQWKQPGLKAAAIACWLAEYSARFSDPLADPALRVADRQKAEEDRAHLFLQSVKDRAFHFLLSACKFFRPEVWHDPTKRGLVDFLLADTPSVPVNAPAPSSEFANLTAGELQNFTEQVVSNLPDVLRRLKQDEEDQRRLRFSLSSTEPVREEMDLERFLVIMAYAYQGDSDACHDFWTDRESNLHGFLRWTSSRLPTPRVAAFCELLRSIAGDVKSADQAHRFLLEDTTMVSGKLRKTFSVSWAQIFHELDTFATSIREKPAVPQTTGQDGSNLGDDYIEGPETSIMLEAYLRLAAHIVRTSPDARNWLLREQQFHLGEVMVQLASSGIQGRIQASCFNMLSAMLVDKVQEVNDGMWVMLDNWLSGGNPAGMATGKPLPVGRAHTSERNYLARFNDNPETASALVALLCALVKPSQLEGDEILDSLPFPEALGAPARHAGIDKYIDFAIGDVFARSQYHTNSGSSTTEVTVLRYQCLELIYICLSTFNEDLVLLANTTDVPVDTTIRASSLATYARLHPFARVMEWLFNSNVVSTLFIAAFQNIEDLQEAQFDSPLVQSVLRCVQVLNLAMKLQATYFDIVRPIVKTQSAARTSTVASAALASFDEVILGELPALAVVIGFVCSKYPPISLEVLELIHKLSSSRRLVDGTALGGSRLIGNRLIGVLASSSDTIAAELIPDFQIFEFDIENGEEPDKLVKARAVLKMLNSSLSASEFGPTVAHCLLGFQCDERSVSVAPDSAFGFGHSLFHVIVACAVQGPLAVGQSNVSWLLNVKRGCWEVILKLALSPLTAAIVKQQLRDMEPLGPASKNQIPVTQELLWDGVAANMPDALIQSSAEAIRSFIRVRELFFQYSALEVRTASETGAYSVQEKASQILRGIIRFSEGGEEPTMSIFELFDFLDLDVAESLVVEQQKYLRDLDLSICVRDDPDIVTAFDTDVAVQLFVLRGRQLRNQGVPIDEQQLKDEIRATIASLSSQNSWRAIQTARIAALESWTDLMSVMLANGGLDHTELAVFALQGLQIILPKLEMCLANNMAAAALLAKLMLALVPAAILSLKQPSQQTTSTANERLLTAFRVCLKAITDSQSDLALRDICYRICYANVNSLPLKSLGTKPSPSQHAKQLLQLVNLAGERLLRVLTEDAFSGRGSTRVSALLFLDSLIGVYQAARNNVSMLKALSKLNFVPVLIDLSVGSVASSFTGDEDELLTTLAYFHTALALLLRICKTADGTQLVLASGLFDAIRDSRLCSTDPDIGLDIDNPVALKQFYNLLSAVLRVIVAVVVSRGPSNAMVLQQAKTFLSENRFSMQAVFKRTSALQKTSGPPEIEAVEVAEEFSKLMLVTGFLECR